MGISGCADLRLMPCCDAGRQSLRITIPHGHYGARHLPSAAAGLVCHARSRAGWLLRISVWCAGVGIWDGRCLAAGPAGLFQRQGDEGRADGQDDRCGQDRRDGPRREVRGRCGGGEREVFGGGGDPHPPGARPMATARHTASPPSSASAFGMRRGGSGAGWWFMRVAPSAAWADVLGWPGALSALTPQRVAAGIALGSA
jgi:hypothetical protein